MSKLKVNELDTKTGTTITVAAGKTLAGTDIIGSTQIAANAVDTSEIAANAVTLAEMAGLARGKLIVGDASGDPSALTVGTADQVLTSDGTDATWAAAPTELPSQTGNAGETLITNATNASWAPRSGRNHIINGNFDIWQRGTSFAGMTQSYTNYQADRWQITPSGNSAVMTVSRQTFAADQTDVPNHPNYFCRCDVTTAASSAASGEGTNKIEDVRTLAGKPVVLTFWAKTVSGTTTMTFRLKQNFGSGGSGDAYTSLGNAALTTSWQKFTLTATCASISGKTVGANSYLGVNWYWNNNSTTTDDIDLAQFQLEEGTVPTLFEYQTIQETLINCQRFYQKTYNQSIAPGSNSSPGACTSIAIYSSGSQGLGTRFFTTMRAAPTVVLYSPDGTSGGVSLTSNGSHVAATAGDLGDSGFQYVTGSLPSSNADGYRWHYTAAAEL